MVVNGDDDDGSNFGTMICTGDSDDDDSDGEDNMGTMCIQETMKLGANISTRLNLEKFSY